jgi:ABC-2 type transport system permease protein
VVVVRLFRANLRKLIRRPATWVTFLLLLALLVLIFVAVTAAARQTTRPAEALASKAVITFPAAYKGVLSIILGIGGMLSVTYGAAIAGSEWTWGTLKAAVARGEGRVRYVVLGYAGVAAFAIGGLLLAFVLGVLAAAAGSTFLGIPLSGMSNATALGELPELLARAALALSMNAALGFAIATIARSQLAGIGVGIGAYFAESIAGVFLPDVIQWFPFAASSAVVARTSGSTGGGGGFGGGAGTTLDPNTAVIVVIAWLVVALVVASAWTERAEISG